MSPDRTVLDPTTPPAGPDLTARGDTPGASNQNFTVDSPTDPNRTDAGDFTPSVAGDPNAATGTFDPNAAPLPTPPTDSGPPTLRKRPLPTVPGYAVHGVLGRGGMGVVYRATQEGLGRQVALKMVLAGGHASAAQLERFAAEARAVAHIRHANIVQIYEIGDHDGLPFFSLELCTGGSLDKLLKHEPQPPKKAAALLEKLARGMAAAHAANIIHRDLKPANVLLDEHGEPKITDFGLAKELGGEDGNTRTGSVLGTPSYMAPEQARGETKRTGPAADQYSLGATLYDLLTGRPPFQGTSVMETLEQVKNREPLSPRELQPGLPRDLETITLKALAKEPEKRYAGCAEFADDLKAFLEGRPIAARPVGAVEKAWRWAKRNPGIAIPSAVAAVFLLATAVLGTTFAVVFDRQKREALELVVAKQEALEAEERAKTEAEAKRKEADASNALTQSALQKVGVDAPAELRKSLYSGRARAGLLDLLGEVLAGQLDPANSAKLPERARLQYHVARAGLLRDAKAVEAEYRKAVALAEPLAAADGSDKGRSLATLIQARLGLATVLLAAGQTAAPGDAELAAADAAARTLVADPGCADISLPARQLVRADVVGRRAERKKLTGYLPESASLRDEQVRLIAEAEADPAAPTDTKRQAARAWAVAVKERGAVRVSLSRDADAEADLKAAVARLKTLDDQATADKKPDDGLRKQYAAAVQELADLLVVQNRLADAAPHQMTLLTLNKALAFDPEVQEQRKLLANAYYRAGLLAEKKNGPGQGLPFFKGGLAVTTELVEAATPATVGEVRARLHQGLFLALVGDHAAATRDIPKLIAAVKNVNIQANVRYEAAWVYALASAVAGSPADKHRDAAFAQLDWLLAPPVEWADAVRLKTDPYLDPLRGDPRFAKVLERAAANARSRAAEKK